MSSPDIPDFERALKALRRHDIAGRALAAVPAGLAAGAGVLLVAGAADAAYGFEPAGLHVLRGVAALAALGASGAIVAAGIRRDLAATADRADLASGGARREIRTAHDMARQPEAPAGSLEAHLRGVALKEAFARLATLPLSARLPLSSLRRAALAFAGVTGVALLVALLAPGPARITASRFLRPDADLPPWTPWSFAVEPGDTEVFYGADAELIVRVKGAKPEGPVYCLVRDPADGRVEKSRAFDRGDGAFGFRIEKAAKPLEYAFSAGRGRSVRHRLDVRLQPRVAEARVTIVPPAYTGLPERSHALGAQDLAAQAGSIVTLTVRSNRPLSGGELRVTPVEAHRARHRAMVAPESVTGDTAVFRWTLKATSRLALTLRDLRGTPSDAPLEMEQKAVADLAPEVALASPPARCFATPDTRLALAGDAQDDLGLDRLALVRTLVGRDDRTEALETGVPGKSRSVERSLDLGRLGVSPGQTLEFRLQASDRNPDKLGVSTSAPAVVSIISREQYAEILRDRATIEEFSARFATLREAMAKAGASLDALEKALGSGDPAKIEAARRAAEEAHRDSLEKLGRLRDDFPAFDLEKELREQAYLANAAISANLDRLKDFKPGGAPGSKDDPAKRLAEMRRAIGAHAAERERSARDAELLEKIHPVMRMAGRFRLLYAEQTEISTDIRRLLDAGRTSSDSVSGARLDELMRRQLRNRTALEEFRRDLAESLAALPRRDLDLASPPSCYEYATRDRSADKGFEQLRRSGESFLRALGDPDPGEAMAVAGKALSLERVAGASAYSETARRQLEALLKKPGDDFTSLCNGECMKFEVSMPSAASTMSQMLKSLRRKPGTGLGQGSGSGMGAGAGEGSGESAESADNLPLFGPSRRSFATAGRSGDATGDPRAASRTAVRADAPEAGKTAAKAHDDVTHEVGAADRVPERHGDAVRRYFGEAEKPARTRRAPAE